MNARTLAADLLQRWQHSPALADDLLDTALASTPLNAADRALAQELFYGCLRQRLALRFLRDQLVTKPPRGIVATLLDLGLYQIFFLDKIPAHAAVHETVELVKQRASPAEVKFANAVLRTAIRNRDTQLAKLHRAEPWIQHSHPQWLWDRWQKRWGLPDTTVLCAWNNLPPPVYVRGDKPWPGVLEPTNFHPLCYRLVDAAKFFAAPGHYYVQDPSTLLAVDVLDPQPGEAVLDMCAAPGGKTTYIAQKMQNRGQIVAADSSNQRLGLVAENCQRLAITIVATMPCEGTRLNRCLHDAKFDRVLLDAPCSNTGVLRRRVDLRWRIEEPEIARLAQLQAKLLHTAATFLKPGGVLVYSTCSLEPDENEQVAAAFAQSHPQFAAESTRSLFPPRDGMDGAFVARWRAT